jgi:hypothetical protein
MNKSYRLIVGIQHNKMAHTSISVPAGKGKTVHPPQNRPQGLIGNGLSNGHRAIRRDRSVLARSDGSPAKARLPRTPAGATEIEKNRCERLHQEIHDPLAADRRGA